MYPRFPPPNGTPPPSPGDLKVIAGIFLVILGVIWLVIQ